MPVLTQHRFSAKEYYRDPHLAGYGSKTVVGAGDKACSPLFADAVVDVSELLKR
jgi:hypothetical protein